MKLLCPSLSLAARATLRELARVWRGLALMVGAVLVFDAVRALARLRHPGALWIDVRWLPGLAAVALLIALGGALISGALWARARLAGGVAAAVLTLHATRDALRAAPLAGWLSCSTLLAALGALAALAFLLDGRLDPARRVARLARIGAGACLGLLGLPLAQIAGSAHADYTRSADAVVVLGARVYADGTPSLALSDRARTGAELVHAGYAPTLIVSGGPGDGATHETEAMRRIAREVGVDEGAIVSDRGGLSTADTARNVAALLHPDAGAPRPRVLVVSHGYHLARSRLALDDVGVVALTVPARETRPLPKLPRFVGREVAAFWLYYVLR